MNSPEITAAKMICKSLDALTREMYMLRKDILEGWKLNAEMSELARELNRSPLPHDRTDHPGSTGEGNHFQL